jgi:hypothetical protein
VCESIICTPAMSRERLRLKRKDINKEKKERKKEREMCFDAVAKTGTGILLNCANIRLINYGIYNVFFETYFFVLS